MGQDMFLHGSMNVVTDSGIKKVSKLKRTDYVVALDRLGYVTYVKPTIIESMNQGLYQTIKTDLLDMKIGVNKFVYAVDGHLKRIRASDIANTLVGCTLELPVNAHEHKRMGIKMTDNELSLYWLSKLKRVHHVDGRMRVPVVLESQKKFIDELIYENEFEYETLTLGKTTVYYINYKVKDKRVSKDFTELLNMKQATLLMDISIMFDRVEGRRRGENGYTVLSESYNADKLIVVAMKAGYRTFIGNTFNMDEGMDSVCVSKKSTWTVKVEKATMSQNETYDRTIMMPREYKGYLVVCDGCVFIMPNEY